MKFNKRKRSRLRIVFFFFVIFGGLLFLLYLGGWMGATIHKTLSDKGCTTLTQDVITLKYPDKNEFNFVAIGDTGTGNKNQKDVAQAIKKVCDAKGCEFLLFLGDNFYPEGVNSLDDPQFQIKFKDIYGDLGIPVFPVLGNHDVKGNSSAQVYYSLKDSQWKMPNTNYNFQVGPVDFYAINSNCLPLGLRDLHKQVIQSKSPWKIVFGHHTIFSSGNHGDASLPLKVLWQSLFQDQIDFYLSGHDHQLEHIRKKGQQTEYIISGAGGKNYRSPEDRKKINPDYTGSKFTYKDNGFVMFEVSPKQIRTKFFDLKGQNLYQFVKKKSILR